MFNEGIVLGFITAVLWGISPLLYRWGGKDLSPVEINFVRNVGAFLSVIFINLIIGAWNHLLVCLPLEIWVFFFLSLILGLFIGDNLFFKSMKLIGVGRSTVVSSSYPIVTVIIASAFLKEKVSSKLFIAGLLVVLGVYLIYEDKNKIMDGFSSLKGYMVAVGAAFAWGLSLALVKVVSNYFTPLSFMTWRVGSLLIVTSTFMLIKRRSLSSSLRELKVWIILGAGGTIGIGVSYLAFVKALQLAPVSQIGIITGMSPMLTTLFASLIYKERISLRNGVGSVFVIAGGMLASI